MQWLFSTSGNNTEDSTDAKTQRLEIKVTREKKFTFTFWLNLILFVSLYNTTNNPHPQKSPPLYLCSQKSLIVFLWILLLPMTLNCILSLQLQVSLVALPHNFNSSTYSYPSVTLHLLYPLLDRGSRVAGSGPKNHPCDKYNFEWEQGFPWWLGW